MNYAWISHSGSSHKMWRKFRKGNEEVIKEEILPRTTAVTKNSVLYRQLFKTPFSFGIVTLAEVVVLHNLLIWINWSRNINCPPFLCIVTGSICFCSRTIHNRRRDQKMKSTMKLLTELVRKHTLCVIHTLLTKTHNWHNASIFP